MLALIYRNPKASCIAIAESYEAISHDQLSRMVAKQRSWPTFLWNCFAKKLIGEGGYLIIDDTVLEKIREIMFGTYLVYSSRWNKSVLEINVVMLLWTDGQRRVPLGIKVWCKGGASKIVLGSKLLR